MDRRTFLKLIGITAGTVIVPNGLIAAPFTVDVVSQGFCHGDIWIDAGKGWEIIGVAKSLSIETHSVAEMVTIGESEFESYRIGHTDRVCHIKLLGDYSKITRMHDLLCSASTFKIATDIGDGIIESGRAMMRSVGIEENPNQHASTNIEVYMHSPMRPRQQSQTG